MSSRFFTVSTSLAISFGFTLLSSTVLAQNIPSSADAGRLQGEIRRETMPNVITTPVELGTAPEVSAPAGAEKVTLVLKEIKITGASQLDKKDIESAYSHLISKKISLADVYDIANRITVIYRNKGYLLSRAIVPEQQIRDGVVRIQIVEGFVSSYHVSGGDYGVRKQVEAYAQKLVSSGVLSSAALERYLLLMNDLPGTSVRSVLVPSRTVPGSSELRLIIEQRRFQGFANLDNYGNSYIGHERVTVGGQMNSPFASSGRLNGTLLWAPDNDEMRYYSVGYNNNIGTEGTVVGMNASYAQTDPSLPPLLGGTLEPEGKSLVVSMNATHPFIRSRELNVNGGLVFDITENKNEYAPGLASIETEDSQRVLRLNGQANFMDRFAGYNYVNGIVSRGLGIFGASDKGDSNLSRANGNPEFTKVNLDFNRLQRIYGPITGTMGLTGQYSANSLLSSEEFGFGGSEYGRGYDFSEITGDHGLAGKLELAYNASVEKKYLNNYQVYTFYDLGKVWSKTAAAGQDSSTSAASVGVGSRLTFTESVRGDAFLAKPLTQNVTSRGSDGDDWRFKFSITSNF